MREDGVGNHPQSSSKILRRVCALDQVVRSPKELADVQDQWNTAMLQKGWTT
jgi:hypothetical protein